MIDGIHVGTQEIEERCAKCNSYLKINTYLNLSTKERILAVTCSKCGTDPVAVKSLKENQNASQARDILPKTRRQTFITDK